MHDNSMELFRLYGLHHLHGEVLEMGPEFPGRPYQEILDTGCRYHYADCCNPPGSVPMTNPYRLDVPDGSYDVVFGLNVAEHVPRIWDWVDELSRVLKAGGRLILVSPVSWPYHAVPVDCWRIMPDGYRELFARSGLEPETLWHGTLTPLEPEWREHHGPAVVTDTVAVGRRTVGPRNRQ